MVLLQLLASALYLATGERSQAALGHCGSNAASGGMLLQQVHRMALSTSEVQDAELEVVEELVVDLTRSQVKPEPTGIFSNWKTRYREWEWNKDHVVWLTMWLGAPVLLVSLTYGLQTHFGASMVRKALPVGTAVACCALLGILARDLGGHADHYSSMTSIVTVVIVMEMGTVERFVIKVLLRMMGTLFGAVVAIVAAEASEMANQHHAVDFCICFAVFTCNSIYGRKYPTYAYFFTMASISFALLFFGYLKKGWVAIMDRLISVLFGGVISLLSVLAFDVIYQDYNTTISLVLIIEKSEQMVQKSFALLDFAYLRLDLAVWEQEDENPEMSAQAHLMRDVTDVLHEVKTFKHFDLEQECQACDGSGKAVASCDKSPKSLDNRCNACDGNGKTCRAVMVGDTVKVKITGEDPDSLNGSAGEVLSCKDAVKDLWIVDLEELGEKELSGSQLAGGVYSRILDHSNEFEIDVDNEVSKLKAEARSAISDQNFVRHLLPPRLCDYCFGRSPGAHFSELMHPVYSAAALARLPEPDPARWLAGSKPLEAARRDLIATMKAVHTVFEFLKEWYRSGAKPSDVEKQGNKLTTSSEQVIEGFKTIVRKLNSVQAKLVEVETGEMCASHRATSFDFTTSQLPSSDDYLQGASHGTCSSATNDSDNSLNRRSSVTGEKPRQMQDRLGRWRFTAICQHVDQVAAALAMLALDLLTLVSLEDRFDVSVTCDGSDLGLTLQPDQRAGTFKITCVQGAIQTANKLLDKPVLPGDRLLMVNGTKIKSIEHYQKELNKAMVVPTLSGQIDAPVATEDPSPLSTVTTKKMSVVLSLKRVKTGDLESALSKLARMDVHEHSDRMEQSKSNARTQKISARNLSAVDDGADGGE